jgi:hypothetical protein
VVEPDVVPVDEGVFVAEVLALIDGVVECVFVAVVDRDMLNDEDTVTDADVVNEALNVLVGDELSDDVPEYDILVD